MISTDQLLSALQLYGLPVLVGAVLVAAVGVPLPASLLLIAAGALAGQGRLPHAWTVVAATAAAVGGDQIGYAVGRHGGRRIVVAVSGWVGGASGLRQAERAAHRWGGPGIFFSRWLVTPLGPALNITSGLAHYPWKRFFLYDLAGELLWTVLYTTAGRVLSDRVQETYAALGKLTWIASGALAAALIGWYAVHRIRVSRARHA